MCFASLVTAAPITVELKVETAAGVSELKVDTNSAQCANGPLECVEVGVGKSPYIRFVLPGACDAGVDDPEYRLSGMRITQVEKVWPTTGSPLNALVAADFHADPDTGEIDFAVGKNKKGKKILKFKNRNTHAYTVFYEILATHCDANSDADDIHLDPEIRNKGNN